MSKEREDASIIATLASRGGAERSRGNRGAGQQGLINVQQHQREGRGGGSSRSAEGLMHQLVGGSSSSSEGGSSAHLQQYSQVLHAQQQGSVQVVSNASGGAISNMQMGISNMSHINTSTPCAACKLLRRRCAQECPFAPYFSPHEPHRFASVHKIYGASNVSKMLMEVPESQRADAANSLVYEANARLRDPVYGCMGVVSTLQQQAQALRAELNVVRGELLHYRARHAEMALQQQQQQQQQHHHHHQQQQQQQQNLPPYSTTLSPSTITPPHDHHQHGGHPLSTGVANHYLSTGAPSDLSSTSSVDAPDTKIHLISWP